MSGETALLKVNKINKHYSGLLGSKIHVLEDVNFEILKQENSGTITSILAPFGGGKSTLLKILAGLEDSDSGKILIENRGIEKSDTVFIPEKPSSFPWLNVRENIEFSKGINNNSGNIFSSDEIISLVGLTGYEEHYPQETISGFRFRVSLGRALMANPKLILIDDCLKSLDSETRSELYLMMRNLIKKTNISILITTTNISEALQISDQIFLMKKIPGTVIKQIQIDSNLRDQQKENYLGNLKKEIESEFSKFPGVSLINSIS